MSNTTAKKRGNVTTRINVLLAFTCGLIIGNLYYAQPILMEISAGIGLSPETSGLVVTMLQAGYCTGVLLIVPLGDLLENRSLIVMLLFGVSLALAAAGLSSGATSFLFAAFFCGMGTTVVQIIIPYGVGLADAGSRGRVFGLLASGAILGVAVSRPLGSLMTGFYSWRVCYIAPAFLMPLIGATFLLTLPRRKPPLGGTPYAAVFSSMFRLLAIPELKMRLVFIVPVFAGFSLFWSAAPIWLRNSGYTQHDITLYSIASAIAPLCAALAGRLADRGLGYAAGFVALALQCCGFLAIPIFGLSGLVFVVSIMLMDSGTHMNNVITQQSIISLREEARSRLNVLCIFVMFCGGTVGSAAGPWLYAHYGWEVVAFTGVGCVVAAFGIHLAGKRFLQVTVRRDGV